MPAPTFPARAAIRSALTDQRHRLAEHLRGGCGMDVHPAWPARLAPPCIVLVPSAPWIDQTEATFRDYRSRLDVNVVAAIGGTDEALGVLEQAVERVLDATHEWAVEQVDQPSLITVSGADYLGTTVTISQLFTTQNH